MLDVVYFIEALSQMGTFDLSMVKHVAGLLLGDRYYLPTYDELIILAYRKGGYSVKDLAEYTHKTRQAINYTLNTKLKDFVPVPKLSVNDAEQINKFMSLVDSLKKAGI